MSDSPKYSLETIYEKLRKIDSDVRVVERRIAIRKNIEAQDSWDLHAFKKFLIVYLEEYKNEYVRDFAENDIDVARGDIQRVLDILRFYSDTELMLWARPLLETRMRDLQFYEILVKSMQNSELKQFVSSYLNDLKARIKELLEKIDSMERK